MVSTSVSTLGPPPWSFPAPQAWSHGMRWRGVEASLRCPPHPHGRQPCPPLCPRPGRAFSVLAGAPGSRIGFLEGRRLRPQCWHSFHLPSPSSECGHLVLPSACCHRLPLTTARRCLLVVSVCVFRMTPSIEYLFMCLSAVCLSSLEKGLFSVLVFLNVSFFLMLNYKSCF